MTDSHLRQQLVNALTVRQAHQSFDDAIDGFPAAHFNTRPPSLSYSFWHLLEHLRIAQADILDYIQNPDYAHRKFPEDYWIPSDAQADEAAWQHTIARFKADLAALVAIAQDPERDLTAQISHAEPGHSILREILIVSAHNAYHIGEFGILRATLGLW
ncbi:MAG: DinB family protein [Chloroflexi bacterium]|nr:DinB family protein [Chloroflexota bacterium]MCY4247819.1 DinB family protein [Chloroflexota bacterium]